MEESVYLRQSIDHLTTTVAITGAVIGIALVAITIFLVIVWVRNGSMLVAIQEIKEQITNLFHLWNGRPCAQHETAIETIRTRVEEQDRRLTRIEEKK